MHYKICKYAIENGFSKKEAAALYFLDGIPEDEQKDLFEKLEKAIGRYKLDKRDWNAFKVSKEYKKSQDDLKKYDNEYNSKMNAAKMFLSKIKVKNVDQLIQLSEDNKLPSKVEFERVGDFNLSMRANIRKELVNEIIFQIAQWKLERKNWRSERKKLYLSQPNKKSIELILTETYLTFFEDPIGTKISDFLKSFN